VIGTLRGANVRSYPNQQSNHKRIDIEQINILTKQLGYNFAKEYILDFFFF